MLDTIQKNRDISHLSAFKTKAQARYYFEIITREDAEMLPEIFFFAKQSGLPIAIIA